MQGTEAETSWTENAITVKNKINSSFDFVVIVAVDILQFAFINLIIILITTEQ